MDKRTNTRLIDVARAAGVSRSTASNVFSHPERVRAEVVNRVESAARALGYSGPDPKGRLLRAGKFNALGVVPPAEFGVADAIRNPVFRLFLLGVAEVCDEAGADLVVISDKTAKGGVRNALVDGFILGSVEHLTEIEAARLRRLPFAAVDFDAGPEVSSVRVDARAGCRAAARHLTDLGHRKFAIVSFLRAFGPPRYFPPGPSRPPEAAGMPTDQEKLRGYAEALGDVGVSIDDVPIVQAHPWASGAAAMILDAAPEATAILAMSAMQGIAVIEEARRRGLRVPRDLSVVGFNDIPEAAACDPPLTTVDGLSTEKGRRAARIVFAASGICREVLDTRLLVRGSTAPVSR
jgi:DNA-binding LacI/PurR family transcriptional regulator